MEGNHIVDNGPRVETDQQPTAGPRGAIIVLVALTPFLLADPPPLDGQVMSGMPAARIAGNTAIVPLGRALWLGGVGAFSIEGNSFASRGLDRDNNPNGVVVTILNAGASFEASGIFLSFANAGKYQPSVTTQLVAAVNAGLIGGKVLFDDNQLLLEPPVPRSDERINSALLIMTADDAGVSGNQSDCRLFQQQLLTNGFVFGWSLRLCDNRFEEPLSAGISAFTWAAMNSTTDNQGTRCFVAVGIPVLTVRTPNRSTITLFVSVFCDRLSAAYRLALRGTGLDA
jgi:hypothetical protein